MRVPGSWKRTHLPFAAVHFAAVPAWLPFSSEVCVRDMVGSGNPLNTVYILRENPMKQCQHISHDLRQITKLCYMSGVPMFIMSVRREWQTQQS